MTIQHRHIEVFRAIMTSGSLTNAARLLHTSQPTLSRELARLEQLLCYALFTREKGRLQPTANAYTLFEEVQRSYIGLSRIIDTATQLAKQQGATLSVVCQPAFAHALMPSVCSYLQKLVPDIQVSITPQESPLLEEWLSMQRFDIGMTEGQDAPPGTSVTEVLCVDEVCVLPANHPLASKTILSPQDFEGSAFVSLAPEDPYRQQVDQVFEQAGVTRQLQWETASAVSVCSLVSAGLGVAIVNPLTALALQGESMIVRRFSTSIPYQVSVVLPIHRPETPILESVQIALRQFANDIQGKLGLI